MDAGSSIHCNLVGEEMELGYNKLASIPITLYV